MNQLQFHRESSIGFDSNRTQARKSACGGKAAFRRRNTEPPLYYSQSVLHRVDATPALLCSCLLCLNGKTARLGNPCPQLRPGHDPKLDPRSTEGLLLLCCFPIATSFPCWPCPWHTAAVAEHASGRRYSDASATLQTEPMTPTSGEWVTKRKGEREREKERKKERNQERKKDTNNVRKTEGKKERKK